jgi:nitrate/nitrite transporter NarK
LARLCSPKSWSSCPGRASPASCIAPRDGLRAADLARESGIGALGWAVNSDTAPKQIAGLSGSVLNVCGNLSSITTPIAIGYIIQSTGSFNGALVYVVSHAFVAMICYLFVVGKIERMILK